MTTMLSLIVALILDAVFGEPKWLWARLTHPAILMGRFVGWLDQTLNCGKRKRLKGVIAASCLVLTGFALGAALSALGTFVEILLAAILIAQRSLMEHVGAVAIGLRNSVEEGRKAVSMIVGRDTTNMDSSAIARGAIESGAENFSDGVVAPAFWFLVAGLPGIFIYKMINTADSMIGYRTPRHEDFGWAAARLDDLLNLIPARLTALMIAMRYKLWADWSEILADARRHRSPNAGWPEAALSRALGVALAGPRSYHGQMHDLPFVNAAGRKTINAPDIDHACTSLWSVWRIMLLILIACRASYWLISFALWSVASL